MKNFFLIVFVVACIFLSNSDCSSAGSRITTFTYRVAESKSDSRYDYDTGLLRLALEATIDTDGPFHLVPSPVMNYARAHAYIQSNALPNLILKLSYEPEFQDQRMDFVPFPVDLGIVGYRVCFAHPETAVRLSQVSSLSDLRDFSHGQGIGWTDVKILKHNGFDVTIVSEYENLFKMAAARRFDLFCRGANELLGEIEGHQHVENLSYDKSIAIFYPFPRFFYSNAANSAGLDRIHRGLVIAYADGSLQKLWSQHYKKSVDFVALDKRKVFTLENPFVEELNLDYEKYFFRPSLEP